MNAQTLSSMQLNISKASKMVFVLNQLWWSFAYLEPLPTVWTAFSSMKSIFRVFLLSANDLSTYSLLSRTLFLEAKESKCHFMLQKWRLALYEVPFYETILSSAVKCGYVKHAAEKVQNKSCLELTWFSFLLFSFGYNIAHKGIKCCTK